MITTLTLLSSAFIFSVIRKDLMLRKELNLVLNRTKNLERLQRRLDRAIEMEKAIYQMFEDGDHYAYELYLVSLEERQMIEIELKRLNIG